MSGSKMLAIVAVMVPLCALAAPAIAATAHNSQAGAWGPNRNPCAPTPYFQQGDCLTSFFTESSPEELPQGGFYQEHKRLRAPDE